SRIGEAVEVRPAGVGELAEPSEGAGLGAERDEPSGDARGLWQVGCRTVQLLEDRLRERRLRAGASAQSARQERTGAVEPGAAGQPGDIGRLPGGSKGDGSTGHL